MSQITSLDDILPATLDEAVQALYDWLGDDDWRQAAVAAGAGGLAPGGCITA